MFQSITCIWSICVATTSRGRTARPAHRAALRAVTCPGVHRSGVGQRLGRGQQHDDAGIAAPRVRGSRRAARPHRDDTLTWAFMERPSGLEPEAQALRGRQRSCWAVPCCRTRSRFPRSEPMPRSGCPHPVLHGPKASALPLRSPFLGEAMRARGQPLADTMPSQVVETAQARRRSGLASSSPLHLGERSGKRSTASWDRRSSGITPGGPHWTCAPGRGTQLPDCGW
ncbi:hypothetical protein M2158_002372 [Streptomyces sp. SAI-144]|nr:hypothetical protein [Streptomyces sp. SAI-144]